MKKVSVVFLAAVILILSVGCSGKKSQLEDTYVEIANSYISNGEYDLAVEVLQKALETEQNKDIQKLLDEVLILQAEDLLGKLEAKDVANNKTNHELAEEDNNAKLEYMISSPKNDTDIGMRSVKIDSTDAALTDEQRLVREYFDRDYLTVQFYDDLLRYADAYSNAQVYIVGTVERIISSTDSKFELLLTMNDATSDTENDLLYVCGTQTDVRLIQGDDICIYGRYTGVDTVTVDGVSLVIPTVKAYRTLFVDNGYDLPQKFEHEDIKQIAKLIFGGSIEVRLPANDNEKGDSQYLDGGWWIKNPYIVELENKSNARFDKFRFYSELGWVSSVEDENSTIIRTIEFMQDFQHFVVISHDWALSTGEIACYDTNLRRVWTREFENVVITGAQIPYDFTKNNIYVATNNRIYIINAETGEDTYQPVYVGAKTEIRKLKEGILAFSADSVDPVMFMDLEGDVSWTTNIEDCLGITGTASVQLVDDKIVAQASFVREVDHLLVIDQKTGELILDCTPSIYY